MITDSCPQKSSIVFCSCIAYNEYSSQETVSKKQNMGVMCYLGLACVKHVSARKLETLHVFLWVIDERVGFKVVDRQQRRTVATRPVFFIQHLFRIHFFLHHSGITPIQFPVNCTTSHRHRPDVVTPTLPSSNRSRQHASAKRKNEPTPRHICQPLERRHRTDADSQLFAALHNVCRRIYDGKRETAFLIRS